MEFFFSFLLIPHLVKVFIYIRDTADILFISTV